MRLPELNEQTLCTISNLLLQWSAEHGEVFAQTDSGFSVRYPNGLVIRYSTKQLNTHHTIVYPPNESLIVFHNRNDFLTYMNRYF